MTKQKEDLGVVDRALLKLKKSETPYKHPPFFYHFLSLNIINVTNATFILFFLSKVGRVSQPDAEAHGGNNNFTQQVLCAGCQEQRWFLRRFLFLCAFTISDNSLITSL